MKPTFFERLKSSLSRRGLLGSVPHALRRLARWPAELNRRRAWRAIEERFDRQYGVDTAGEVIVKTLKVDSPNVEYAVDYTAIAPGPFYELMNQIPVDYERFLFIDFGCGKGRAMMMASAFPFKKIIGVEFSAQLLEVAKKNLRNYRSPTQKCQAFELICQDAMAYPIPPEPAVFYFGNPFGAEVMKHVAAHVAQSLVERPRPAFVVYYHPLAAAVWDGVDGLERLPIRQPTPTEFKKARAAAWVAKAGPKG